MTFKTLAIGSLLTVASVASANLVTNGSFETGDLTGWNQNNLNFTFVAATGFDGYTVLDGTQFLAMGNVGSDGEISQMLATTAGGYYDVSFDFGSDGQVPNDVSFFFDGTLFASGSDIPSLTPQNYTFLVQSSGANTLLDIFERNDPAYLYLDNVQVNAHVFTPEPITMSLGIAGIGLFIRRRKATTK